MAQRGLSVAALIEASALDKRVVEAIVHGRYTPSPEQRQRLAAAMGLDKARKKAAAVPTAHVEKDRTGVLSGKSIAWPGFDNLAKPLLGLLGTMQAAPPTDDEVGVQDAEALARQEREHAQRSADVAGKYTTQMAQAGTVADLQRVAAGLTPAVKALLVPNDLTRVRGVYVERLAKLRPDPARNGK
jgi:hypothetical protein